MDSFDLAKHHGHELRVHALYSPEGPETDIHCVTCNLLLCTLYPQGSKTRIGDNGTEMPFPRDAIKDVVDYLWNDEEKHYEESDKDPDHIFCRLVKINKYLRGDNNED